MKVKLVNGDMLDAHPHFLKLLVLEQINNDDAITHTHVNDKYPHIFAGVTINTILANIILVQKETSLKKKKKENEEEERKKERVGSHNVLDPAAFTKVQKKKLKQPNNTETL